MATVEVRQLRERIRCRMALVGLRAGVKNRIQALLHRLAYCTTTAIYSGSPSGSHLFAPER